MSNASEGVQKLGECRNALLGHIMKKLRLAGFIAICVATLITFCRFMLNDESVIDIENTGNDKLIEVVVRIADRCYTVGTLYPGNRTRVVASPSFDTHVEIWFGTVRGESKLINCGGYLTPGMKEHLYIKLDSSGKSHTEFPGDTAGRVN
jgi:hypothetical protein